VAVNGQVLGGGQGAVKDLVALIQGSANQTLTLQTDQSGQRRTLRLTPTNRDGIGRVGAELLPSGKEQFRPAHSPLEVISQANHDFTALTGRTIEGFTTLITHFGETAGQVSGPVKIVEMGAQLSRQGGSSLFLFTALISINLAVLNALPLPLLDGGQMVLLLLEGIRGRRLPQKFEMVFLQSGFVFLVGLSVLLIVKDTSQLPLIQQWLHPVGR
jgi:RIP metalloprotease RseP